MICAWHKVLFNIVVKRTGTEAGNAKLQAMQKSEGDDVYSTATKRLTSSFFAWGEAIRLFICRYIRMCTCFVSWPQPKFGGCSQIAHLKKHIKRNLRTKIPKNLTVSHNNHISYVPLLLCNTHTWLTADKHWKSLGVTLQLMNIIRYIYIYIYIPSQDPACVCSPHWLCQQLLQVPYIKRLSHLLAIGTSLSERRLLGVAYYNTATAQLNLSLLHCNSRERPLLQVSGRTRLRRSRGEDT